MTTHFPSLSLAVGGAPNPWISFNMVMVTHIVPLECVHFDEYNADNVTLKTSVHTCRNASEKHDYFALAFTGMNSVPSRFCELWRQPVYTRASVLHALSYACACTEKHPLTIVSGKLDVIPTVHHYHVKKFLHLFFTIIFQG